MNRCKSKLLTSAIVASLLLSSCSKTSKNIPVSKESNDFPGYATKEAAAIKALGYCSYLSREKEYGGGIYFKNNKYYYTIPVTTNSGKDIEEFKINLSKNSKLVALFHTHPSDADSSNDNSEVFSAADIKTAQKMNLPSYVGILKNYTVIMFIPKKDAIQSKDLLGKNIVFSYGHPVGKF